MTGRLRRGAGLVLAGIGSFLAVFALVQYLVVGPVAARAPLNEYQVTQYTGQHVRYFSTALLRELTGVTLRETVTVKGDQAAGTATRAVWDQFSYAYDQTHAVPYQSLTERLGFDRATGVLVRCCAGAVGGRAPAVWSGQAFSWPAGTRGVTYDVFDPVLRRPEPARFSGPAIAAGLRTDTFTERVPPVRFASQVLPGTLVGRKKASVLLGEYYQTVTTFAVDPVSGRVVDVSRDEQLTLRESDGKTALVLFGGDLRMQPASVRALAAAARRRDSVIRAATVTVPAAAGAAGIAALVIGVLLVLVRRRRPDRAPAAELTAAVR